MKGRLKNSLKRIAVVAKVIRTKSNRVSFEFYVHSKSIKVGSFIEIRCLVEEERRNRMI